MTGVATGMNTVMRTLGGAPQREGQPTESQVSYAVEAAER